MITKPVCDHWKLDSNGNYYSRLHKHIKWYKRFFKVCPYCGKEATNAE